MFLLLFFLCADSFDASLRAGLIALNANQLSVAQAELEIAAHLKPNDARVWLGLAQTYSKIHETVKAETAASRAEELTEDLTKDPRLFRALALYYSETGNAAKTAEVVHRLLKLPGLDEGMYFGLADLCLKQQYFEPALDAATAGLKTFGQSAQLELTSGVAYYGLRRFPEAIDAFLRTVELDPGVEQPYTFLGRVVEQSEDRLPRIQMVFAALTKRAPGDYRSSFYYGKSLAVSAPKEAEALLKQSIALNDSFAESHFELSSVLDGQHRFQEAAQEMKLAIALHPDDPVAHYRLARLYDRLGKPEEARSERRLHAKLSGK